MQKKLVTKNRLQSVASCSDPRIGVTKVRKQIEREKHATNDRGKSYSGSRYEKYR